MSRKVSAAEVQLRLHSAHLPDFKLQPGGIFTTSAAWVAPLCVAAGEGGGVGQRITWFLGATMCQEQVTPAG